MPILILMVMTAAQEGEGEPPRAAKVYAGSQTRKSHCQGIDIIVIIITKSSLLSSQSHEKAICEKSNELFSSCSGPHLLQNLQLSLCFGV